MHSPIRVLVVDDSTVIRGFLSRIVDAEPDMRVVATAFNGRVAVDVLDRREIDIVLLDIEMPEMNGLEALPLILQKSPHTRVIMASSLTEKGAEVTVRALSLGAADYVTKPSARSSQGLEPVARELIQKIRVLAPKGLAASSASATPPTPRISDTESMPSAPSAFKEPAAAARFRPHGIAPRVLGIASSTGGPNALAKLFHDLPSDFPLPILIAQHMPPLFTRMLAERIEKISGKKAFEAADGMKIEPGNVYIAPGDFHMVVAEEDGQHMIRLNQDPPENFCRPSADPLFRSMAQVYGGAQWIAVLTGMGHDGKDGAQTVAERGGRIVAQDQESSVVWGMPRAVAEAGIAHDIVPLDRIGAHLASSAGALR